ncbi:MAG: helix-turn-helix transcriptional regulator, partial [Bacteriovoracaceae bacterium]
CEAILEQIEEAYSVIGVAEKRREYDQARGLNQENTPEGFSEEMKNAPEYKPKKAQEDLTKQTEREMFDAASNQRKEEFIYNQTHSGKNEVSVSKVQAYKKFGLNYNIDPSFEQEIENCSEYTGEFLKGVREYKNVSVERMADMTKISKTYIRNIEQQDYTKLPADVYTRGFVYQYAKCLKLNPDLVATSYIHHLRQLKNPNNPQ